MTPRPMYWSIRRELWENRSIYVAPLAVAAVFLFGFSLSTIMLPHRLRAAALDPAKQERLLVMPFSAAASLIILTSFIVGAFYCLDALHGERRDRSILFWKSLPVSDLTTVLSKAGIPLVVLPSIAIVVSLATQLVMLFLSTVVLSASSVGAAALWSRLPLFQMTLIMFYGVTVHVLWHAPLYAWLLLISGWARRMPLLWVVLPPMALGIFERHTIHTSLVLSLVRYRLIGAMKVAFATEGHEDIRRLAQLDPLRFLITPGLWIGLIAAAAFLAAAARLRRYREPI
jgi:ABC-2 type transport system permease protein